MREIARPKGEGLLQKMFAENRRIIRDLNAIEIGPGIRNADNIRKMPSNPRFARPSRLQLSQTTAKSSKLNDQCFDSKIQNRHSTQYPDNNFRNQLNQCGRQNSRDVKSAPYHRFVKNRTPKQKWAERSQSMSRGWNEGSPQSITISYKDEPGLESRSIWKSNKLSTNSLKVTPFRSSVDSEVSSYSKSFFSSWFPDGNNAKSSYQNSYQKNNFAPRYGDTFDSKLSGKRDTNGALATGKWNRCTNLSGNFDSHCDYEGQFDDFYPEVSSSKKWHTPPQSNSGLNDGEFYAEICDAVFKKVIEQLRDNQKSGSKSLSSQRYAGNDSSFYPTFKTISMRDDLFQSEISQRLDYLGYNKNHFKEDGREYDSKPSFNQSFRGKGASRDGKRKFFAKNRPGLS